MNATWIVSANAGRARLFSQANAIENLEEIDDMINAAVRLRTAETESDKIGPTAAGKSMHNVGGSVPNKTYEPPQTPTEHETELFARSVAELLLQGHQDGRFTQLALVASPQFLGVLRKLLPAQLKPLVSVEINKDYTHCNAGQLRQQIRAHRVKT